MAWTTPRTWVASEIVTASMLNTHLRDNLLALDADKADATELPSRTSKTDVYAAGGSPYVNALMNPLHVVTIEGDLKILLGAWFTNSNAPGSQRIIFYNLPLPTHSTAAVFYPGVQWSGNSNQSGIVWSPSESLWFLSDGAGNQISGGWTASQLITFSVVGQFQ